MHCAVGNSLLLGPGCVGRDLRVSLPSADSFDLLLCRLGLGRAPRDGLAQPVLPIKVVAGTVANDDDRISVTIRQGGVAA